MDHKTKSVASVTSQSSSICAIQKVIKPACGVQARKLKNYKLTRICSGFLHSSGSGKKNGMNKVMSEERSGTSGLSSSKQCDLRPNDEYDLPWDSHRSSKQKISRSLSVKEEIRQFSKSDESNFCFAAAGTHRSVESHSSAEDSGVYEEPWDSSRSALQTDGWRPENKITLDSQCSSSNHSLQCCVQNSSDNRFSCENRPFNPRVSQDQRSLYCRDSPASLSSFSSRNSSDHNSTAFDNSPKIVSEAVSRSSEICRIPSDKTFTKMRILRKQDDQKLEPHSSMKSPANWHAITLSQKSTLLDITFLKGKQVKAPRKLLCKHSQNVRRVDNDSKAIIKVSQNVKMAQAPTDSEVTCVKNIYDIPWESSDVRQPWICCETEDTSDKSIRITPEANSHISKQIHSKKNLLTAHPSCIVRKSSVDFSFESKPWYHGDITRFEAEECLKTAGEGAFLVRSCEVSQSVSSMDQDYALSMRYMNTSGFLHMKIQLNDRNKWVLGYFSYPFDSIPQMISFYSHNKLPVKGAEHICLGRPVFKELAQ